MANNNNLNVVPVKSLVFLKFFYCQKRNNIEMKMGVAFLHSDKFVLRTKKQYILGQCFMSQVNSFLTLTK